MSSRLLSWLKSIWWRVEIIKLRLIIYLRSSTNFCSQRSFLNNNQHLDYLWREISFVAVVPKRLSFKFLHLEEDILPRILVTRYIPRTATCSLLGQTPYSFPISFLCYTRLLSKILTPSESSISYVVHPSYLIFVDAKFKLLDPDQILNLKHTTNEKTSKPWKWMRECFK